MYPETITLKADALNLTEEEFFNFCSQNKELKFEMDSNKQIYIMAPTGGITGNQNAAVLALLYIWNKQLNSGYVFDSSTGFNLPSGAMRSPDVAWIAKESWEKLSIDDRKHFPHICPDFIIEILSESDSLKNTKEKMQEWLKNGCRLAWIIDFENKNVYIYKPKTEVIQQSFEQCLNGEDVLRGFELNLNEFA